VSARTTLREQLARLPDSPGVYLYRDAADTVLYVGKAKSLRKRVLSYFRAPLTPDDPASLAARPGSHPKAAELVDRIDRVEVLITGGESEALILEANLVKRHRPQFNIRLRDDKSYPYIAISLDEEYPRVYFTRERHRRDRVYFGPFSNASKVRETLNVLARIFPSRPCEGPEPGRPSGIPCLDYHIQRCLAPCVDYITKAEYRALVDQIIAFLSGRYRGLERELDGRMRAASQAQEFEQAAIHRNRLAAVRHLMERQWATNEGLGTLDVIGVAMEGDAANVQVLQVRDGVMQDRQSFHLDLAGEDDLGAVVEQFAIEYYALAIAIPPLVVVPSPMEGEGLTRLLSERRDSRVEVRHAERGDKRRLADLAARNARFALDQDRKRHELARVGVVAALEDGLERLGIGRVLPGLVGAGQTFLTTKPSLAVCVALFWVGGWGLARDIDLEEQFRRERARAEALQREAEHAQLLALKSHLDPHFLFNTLNAIAEWCREDGAVAEKAIVQLSSMLRTMLGAIHTSTWPLAKEVELVDALIALHLVRDPSAFTLERDVPEPLPAVDVPPMMLLPIAENAMKHGPLARHKGPVRFSIVQRQDGLEITLSNPGRFTGRREGGSGLPIVAKRLALAYGDRATFAIEAEGDAKDGERCRATVTIPLR